MTFIRVIPPDEAVGELKTAYERDPAAGGPGSSVRAWSLRPEAFAATQALRDSIRPHLDERRAEFVRVVAASSVKCTVCTLAHGAVLLKSSFFTPEQLEALATDYTRAGLDPLDEAVANFVRQVVLNPDKLVPADVEALRATGLDDAEIFDIVLWARFCTFWSGVHDAIGYEPSPGWVNRTRPFLGQRLWDALSVGRNYDPGELTGL